MQGAQTVRRTALVFTILAGAVVALLVDGQLGPMPAAAAAQVITACPGPLNPIIVDTELGADLVATPADNPCVRFGAPNIGLRLRGFAIDMRGAGVATAIDTNGQNRVLILGDDGFVVTSYVSPGLVAAILVNGGSDVRVEEVQVRNVQVGFPAATAPCVLVASRGGTGMFLTGVTGARVIGNLVECYARGVDVFASTASSTAFSEREIGRNIIRDNTSNATECEVQKCSGLRLGGASGWYVLFNTVTGNGFSPDSVFEQVGIGLFGGSSGNKVLRNVADNNIGPGISVFVQSGSGNSSGNSFVGNHATGNGPTVPADLADAVNPTVVNVWNPNNICNNQQGLGIPPGVCNPGEM